MNLLPKSTFLLLSGDLRGRESIHCIQSAILDHVWKWQVYRILFCPDDVFSLNYSTLCFLRCHSILFVLFPATVLFLTHSPFAFDFAAGENSLYNMFFHLCGSIQHILDNGALTGNNS